MAVHLFDTEDAEKYGVTAAVLLYNIRHWCEKNAANDKHFHDGQFWTYNSVKAFEELFPYLTSRKIRTALDKLEESGVIKTGNFNDSKYDRTTWYSCQIHLSEKSNGFDQKVSSHTYVNTDVTTDKKTSAPRFDAQSHIESLGVQSGIVSDWLALRKAKKATVTQTAIAGIVSESLKAGVSLEVALATCCARGWSGFKAEWIKDDKTRQQGPQGYPTSFNNRVASGSATIMRALKGE